MKKKIEIKMRTKSKLFYNYKVLSNNWELYYKEYIVKQGRRHLFHIVDESPWPLSMGLSVLIIFIGFTMYVHIHERAGIIFFLGLALSVYTMINWWRDVIRESTFLGHHTSVVRQMLRAGMKLFIVTEVMFFFGFFWAFFHSSVVFTPDIGIWPPAGFFAPTHKGIALINTSFLLASGISVTLVHRSVKRNNRMETRIGFAVTLFYAFLFLSFQCYEYFNLEFTITDGVYGATFYMLTGLHCLHVIAGTIFLIVCYSRFECYHFSRKHHLGLLFAIWYWHFVDIVWIGLFFIVYWWGGWKVTVDPFRYMYDLYIVLNI